MVGIVIVSHSAKLAEGVVELARGMAGPEVRLAAAGGLDSPDHPLGTDVSLISRALAETYSDDGVVVLMDLGSAILSAEMAVELLPEDQRARVVLCEAPLVEGAVAAAVQAKLGSPLAQVAAEARAGLAPKVAQLEPLQKPAAPASAPPLSTHIAVQNAVGLHARPAARFVQTAGRFRADVRVTNTSNGRGPANAKSITSVLTLGARLGHTLTLSATGPDAQEALEALQQLAESKFGDAE